MKFQNIHIAIFLFLILQLGYISDINGQSVTSVYTLGNGATDKDFIDNSNSSDCPLLLGVRIPDQAIITSIDVEYYITAVGDGKISQQRSQLRCVSTGGTNEKFVYEGIGDSEGTYYYHRTNLNIANNVIGGGTVLFELHTGRTFGNDGCDDESNYVDNNWKITVHFAVRSGCNVMPFGGIAKTSKTMGCSGIDTKILLSSTSYSEGSSGLTYQWQRSSNGSSGWTNIPGATDPESGEYTANSTMFFRLSVTCTNTSETAYSNVLNYIASACQTYNIGDYANTINTCNALFYDSGGISDYSNGENSVIKFCSSSGNHLRVDFLSFNTEDNGESGRYQERYDKLRVWDGPNTSSAPMFEFSGIQTSTNEVPVVISSGQCLSFTFISDETVVRPGWVAHVSCTNEESNIASQYCGTAPNICNLNGYQGTTSNFYNIERIYNQIQDEGEFFPGLSALDNNSFITFVAAASTVVLNIEISNCSGGFSDPNGIQFAVYSGSNCDLNSLVSSTSYIDPGLAEGNHSIIISNLVAGSTYYLMTDGNYGAICDYSINAQSGVELAKVNPVQNSICEGESATITASGGSSFQWSGPNGFSSNQATINVTQQGVYTVTITGGLSACPSEVVLTSILEVNPIVATPVFNIPDLYCKGATIPALPTTSLNGVNGVWTPELDNNQTTTYTFTTNNGVCTDPYFHTITISPDIYVQSIEPDCFGGNGLVSFSSNSQQTPLSYTVNDVSSQSPVSLPAGNYTIIVTDANGCTASYWQIMNQPEKLLIDYELTDRSCFGITDADLKLTAIGGTEPYFFTLLNGEMNFEGEEHFNLTDSVYKILVHDINSCSDQKDLYIYEPAQIFADYMSQNPSCIGNIDGLIKLNIGGGTEPYQCRWDDKTVDTTFVSGLSEGTYDITIVDANGCMFEIKGVNLTDLEFECLSIPNAFSPNSDGINDTWIIENLKIYTGAKLYVYNRWGQLVYNGNPDEKWNGTINNKYVPAGSYIYLLDLNDGTEPLKGVVTVVY